MNRDSKQKKARQKAIKKVCLAYKLRYFCLNIYIYIYTHVDVPINKQNSATCKINVIRTRSILEEKKKKQ
jgi:hypothetical protein